MNFDSRPPFMSYWIDRKLRTAASLSGIGLDINDSPICSQSGPVLPPRSGSSLEGSVTSFSAIWGRWTKLVSPSNRDIWLSSIFLSDWPLIDYISLLFLNHLDLGYKISFHQNQDVASIPIMKLSWVSWIESKPYQQFRHSYLRPVEARFGPEIQMNYHIIGGDIMTRRLVTLWIYNNVCGAPYLNLPTRRSQ